jgi:hypothetical protein
VKNLLAEAGGGTVEVYHYFHNDSPFDKDALSNYMMLMTGYPRGEEVENILAEVGGRTVEVYHYFHNPMDKNGGNQLEQHSMVGN